MTSTLSPTDRTLSRLALWTDRVLKNAVSDFAAGKARRCNVCQREVRSVEELVEHECRALEGVA